MGLCRSNCTTSSRYQSTKWRFPFYKFNNSANAIYYSDRWTGAINMTSYNGAPLFMTKPHFLDADPYLVNAVNVYWPGTTTQINATSADDIFADVEPYSGVSLGAMQR